MIATTSDTVTFETYVNNIIRAFESADADQRARGLDWYYGANQLATLLAEGDTAAGAGVLAALSPLKSWYSNVDLAKRAFKSGVPSGHFSDAVAKATAIMAGEDPLEILPQDSKSWNFYRCIVDPTDPDPVVVDRHGHDLAINEVYGSADRGLSSKRRYAMLAHCYREAARRLGVIPSVVQATTWLYWTETHLGELPRRPGRKNILAGPSSTV